MLTISRLGRVTDTHLLSLDGAEDRRHSPKIAEIHREIPQDISSHVGIGVEACVPNCLFHMSIVVAEH